jgi:3-oxoacyl-[acyl-carrier-protein] synthase II
MVAERIVVRGIGMVGSFGATPADLFDRIASGSPRLTPTVVRQVGGEMELSAHVADLSRLLEFIPKRGARRIDRLSGLSLLAAHLAQQDAGMALAGERTGLVLATGYGASRSTAEFLDSIIDGTDLGASPTAFAGSVHCSAASQVSIGLGIRGPALTVTQFEVSCGEALRVAVQWLASRRVDTVLVGAADEYSATVGYCWQRLTGEAAQAASPGAAPGEGAAFLVLQRGAEEESAAPCLGAIATGAAWASAKGWQPDTVILGNDGLVCQQACYQRALPAGLVGTCLTPFYGVFPASQMLDVAAVLAAWRTGGAGLLESAACRPPPSARRTDARPTAACLKFDLDGRYSLVQLDFC